MPSSSLTCGERAGSSASAPLQPTHVPPHWRSAASTPTARPPGAAEIFGRLTRCETMINGFTDRALLGPSIPSRIAPPQRCCLRLLSATSWRPDGGRRAAMKSYWIVQSQRGLELEPRDVPTPKPKEGQLVVEVRASSFNRGELLTGHGAHDPNGKPAGIECAGEIADAAAGFHVGERVMGRCIGGFADYALMDAREAMRVPPRLSWDQAAAIPLAFMVAHDMLVAHGRLERGDWLLITGVSSGVGVASLQVGKALGA